MSTNKVHSKGQVPFAWENRPGIRKEDTRLGDGDKGKHGVLPLPPPYLQPESGRSSPVNLQNIPLPPCAFLPLVSRSGSYKEENDPFLIAYKKCTNGGGGGSSSSRTTTRRLHKKNNGSSLSTLSCKHSCSVRDDSIVRISQLPIPKPTKEIIGSFYKFDD